MEDWKFDEFKQQGVDYSKEEIANDYDNQHKNFRNYKKEVEELVNDLDINGCNEKTVIDLACGTGALTLHSAEYFKKIYAVDVSQSMLKQAKAKAKENNISNIEFINSGFLSYRNNEEKADIVITKFAFHHLPDFWKQIALFNINKMLKPGGTFYIHDVVFHFETNDYETKINNWINEFGEIATPEMKAEAAVHIKDEFSTFDWILQGLIKRAGFEIEKVKLSDGFTAEYFCKKINEV